MRLQINVSDELCTKIDNYAKQMGVSRSALCTIALGQYVLSMDRSNDVIDFLGKTLGSELSGQIKSVDK